MFGIEHRLLYMFTCLILTCLLGDALQSSCTIDGKTYDDGATIGSDECSKTMCMNGQVAVADDRCMIEVPHCSGWKEKVKGQCCPICHTIVPSGPETITTSTTAAITVTAKAAVVGAAAEAAVVGAAAEAASTYTVTSTTSKLKTVNDNATTSKSPQSQTTKQSSDANATSYVSLALEFMIIVLSLFCFKLRIILNY